MTSAILVQLIIFVPAVEHNFFQTAKDHVKNAQIIVTVANMIQVKNLFFKMF